ncbi:tetratricopeptide repeat protein [Paenibacillus glucanolyticus]|uniref:tetratricopeptide repeat protein n=1 Tax=Paenibacillus glucanolyticus TaxID=59843 RepID=UPI0034CFCD85
MTDIWSFLGIQPTEDAVLIKRAYMARLKFHHPEEDPEGFQKLRTAYDAALKEAKDIQRQTQAPSAVNADTDHPGVFDDWTEDSVHERDLPDIQEQNSSNSLPAALANEFLLQAVDLYDDIQTRVDEDRWITLLEDEKFSGFETRQRLQFEVLRLFADRAWAPGPVWRLLDETFAWSSMEIEMQELFPKTYVDYVMMQLEGFWDLRYDYVTGSMTPLDELEQFLAARSNAQICLVQGNVEGAEHWLQEAAQIMPEEPDLNRMIGELCLQYSNWEEAFQAFKRMEASGNAEVHHNSDLAYCMLQLGMLEDAYSMYQKVLVHTPDHAQALTGAAQCLEQLGRIKESRELYLRIKQLCPWDLHAHTQIDTLNQRLEQQMKMRLEVEDRPDQMKTLDELAGLYMEQQQYDQAVGVWLQLVQLGELTARQNYQLGYSLHQEEQYEKATRYYAAAGNAENKDEAFLLELRYQTGINAYQQSDYPAAIQQFELVLALDPGHLLSLRYLAVMSKEAQRFEEAVLYYKKALDIEDLWFLHADLGSCYYHLDQYEESVFHFGKAKLDDDKGQEHYFEYGSALRLNGQYREAVQIFDADIERNNHPYAYYNRAFARFMLKEFELCRADLRIFMELVPGDSQFDANLISGISSFYLKDWNAAVSFFNEMLKYLPSDMDRAQYIKLFAAALLAARRFKEVIQPLEEVLRLDDQNEWAMLHTVRVHAELQNWDKIEGSLEMYFETFDLQSRNPYIWFYGGVFLYYVNNYKEAAKFFKLAYQVGLRGDTCSYYSLVLYQLGESHDALSMAREALQDRPGHGEYEERLKQMEEQMNKRKNLFARLGLLPTAANKPVVQNLDYPDILGDPQLQNEYPGVVIKQ